MGQLFGGKLHGDLSLVVEVGWDLWEEPLRPLQDVFGKLLGVVVRDGHGLVVGDVLGHEELLPGGGHGDDLPLDLGVDHAGLELVVDGGVGGDPFVIVLLLVLASRPQVLEFSLEEGPLFLQDFLLLLVHAVGAPVDEEFVEPVLVAFVGVQLQFHDLGLLGGLPHIADEGFFGNAEGLAPGLKVHGLLLGGAHAGAVLDALDPLPAFGPGLLGGGDPEESKVDIVDLVDVHFLEGVDFADGLGLEEDLEDRGLIGPQTLLSRHHGEVGYLLEGHVYLGGRVFVLNGKGEFAAIPDRAVSKLEEILFEFDLGAHCVGLELDDDGVVSLGGEHDAVLVDILGLELGAVFLVIDGALLVGRGEGVGGGVDLVAVINLGPADEVHLQLLEGLDDCALWLHEHDPFALLAADFVGGLDVDELLGGNKVALAEYGAVGHALGTVVDHKSPEDALLAHEHCPEVEAGALVAFGVDYVAGVVN